MGSKDTVPPAGKGLNILVICAGDSPPNEVALRKLLKNAGCKVASIVFATPGEVANETVDPADFDRVLALLDDELAADDQLDAGTLVVAQCGQGLIGVWPPGVNSESMHPAVQKYGKGQVPWDPDEISRAIGTDEPQPFQSSSGGKIAPHDVKPNKC